MSYSGTISQTMFNTGKVIDSAVRRCRIPLQAITSEMVDTATHELYLLLSSLSNEVMPLWCMQKQIYPIYEGAPDIVTRTGTVDVLEATLRQLHFVDAPATVAPAERIYAFDLPTVVSTVGVLWGPVPGPLEFWRSPDGVTWTSVGTASPDVGAGERSWFDLDVAAPSKFFRITGNLDLATVDLGNSPSEIPLARLNRNDFVNMPNKTFTSARPLQYWLDRQVRTPVMRLWPSPSAAATNQQIVVWAHRHIMDVGTLQQEIEVPQRWYDAVVAGLAARLAAEIPEVDPSLMGPLDAKARALLTIAQGEERDNSTRRLAPDFSVYTA